MAYERTSRRNIPQSMPLVCLGIPYNVAEYNTDINVLFTYICYLANPTIFINCVTFIEVVSTKQVAVKLLLYIYW